MADTVFSKSTKFKGIDKNPSLLGFGCMRLPLLESGKPDIDVPFATKMIDYAIEHGVNYFDTAYPYHQGMSETFIGEALKKYPRESFYLADKMPSWLIKSAEDAKRIFFEQLEKCQVEYFDYYLCHALSRDSFKAYLIPGVMDFLYLMKKEGRIRHLGFSFHDTPDILDQIIHTYEWDFVQLQLNYLDWDFQDAKKQYEIVRDYGVPVIVMEPVRGGTLATLSPSAQAVFQSANPDASLASWAIRYAASKESVMVVLSGMSNEVHTEDNIKTMTNFKEISTKEQEQIDEALKAYLDSKTIPCTACQYCMPCPEGVEIPNIFKIYNHYAIGKNKHKLINDYLALGEYSLASACIACGKCMDHCPQKIEIPTRMSEIDELTSAIQKEMGHR